MKDKFAIAFALILQLCAIVWWASQLNTGVKALQEDIANIHAKILEVEKDVNTISNQLSTLNGKVEAWHGKN